MPIEDAVRKELPIINCAMLIGDKRKFLSMLLTLKVCLGPGPSGSHTQPGHVWHGQGATGMRVGSMGPGTADSQSAAALSAQRVLASGVDAAGAQSLSQL